MTGRVEIWATVEWNRRSPVCESFTKTFSQVFQTVSPGREVARALMTLRQSKYKVSDYAIEFR